MAVQSSRMTRPSVLLVDDQPANLLALEATLAHMDVTFVRAETGARALELTDTCPYAAIVLDDRLPDMRGEEVARMTQERLGARCPPILLYTAADYGRAELAAWRAAGVADVLQKPGDPDVIRRKVAAMVQRTLEAHRAGSEGDEAAASRRC